MPPYAASETTPSWMRAPAPSFSPMTGAPTDSARSMTLWIFSANTSPSAPPKTVKSWANTKTLRPSIVPQPVTTPSVSGRLFSMPKPWARCRASMSSSTNEPGSSSFSRRSRAVSLPRSCWRSTATSLPAWRASSRSAASCSSRSSIGWGLAGMAAPPPSPWIPSSSRWVSSTAMGAGYRDRRSPFATRRGPVTRGDGAGDALPADSAAGWTQLLVFASIGCRSLWPAAWTSTLRGFALSETGIVSVRTPWS